MARQKYTDEEFRLAVETSCSISEALRKLNLKPAGGNYKVFHVKLKQLKISDSHFTGQGHLKGKSNTWSPKNPINDLLTENSRWQSNHLRKRLINENILAYECSICKISEWLGGSLSLELDHINGDNSDNRIENLRILCPNCHSQTKTYRGKNIKRL